MKQYSKQNKDTVQLQQVELTVFFNISLLPHYYGEFMEIENWIMELELLPLLQYSSSQEDY